MDPITGTLLATLGTSLIKDIFSPPASAGPTQAQLLAIIQAQQQAEAQKERTWLIAGALALAAVLTVVVVSRK